MSTDDRHETGLQPALPPPPLREPQEGLGDLVRRLADDATTLARQEIDLAKREVTEGITGLAKGSGLVAAGGVLALAGVLTLIVFLVIGLGILLGDRYWLSSLIVALVFLAVGGGIFAAGKRRLSRTTLAPEATRETVRETGAWAAAEAESFKRELAR